MQLDARLLRLAWTYRWRFALTIGIGFTGGCFAIWQARLLSRIIQEVFLNHQALTGVFGLMVVLLLVILGRSWTGWGMERYANLAAITIKRDLRQKLFGQMVHAGPAFTRAERSGELINALIQGIDELEPYFSQYLPQLILAFLIPVTYLVFIVWIDPLSAAILLLTAPLIPVFMILIGNMASASTRQKWEVLSKLSAYFLDIIQGLPALKMLGRSREQVGKVEAVCEDFQQTTMKVLRITFLSALVLELVATISTAVVAVQVGLRLLYGWINFEQAFFVLILTPEYYLPLRNLGTRFHVGMAGKAAARRIFQLLEATRRVKGGSSQEITSTDAKNDPLFKQPIHFKNVSYHYPDGEQVLSGVSFSLLPGAKTALVGYSGVGKSTLIHLLLGFIEPTYGEINWGELPIQSIGKDAWYQAIGWVPQNPYLFHDSVAANIRLQRPEAGMEEVIWAAQQANAAEFIRQLPAGYETPIGERGCLLSAGQAQRIALARAFFKNAPILILDEGTANLDPETELAVQQSIRKLAETRTVLTIAHRLNTVMDADQVIVLDHGCIVEQGSYTELIEQGGLYAKMVNTFRGEEFNAEIKQRISPSRPIGRYPLRDGIQETVVPFDESDAYQEPYVEKEQLNWIRVWGQLLHLLSRNLGWVALAVFLGFMTVMSSIGLMGASAYIIAMAALHPSIAELQIAIISVRFFGISRGIFRYLERLVSHRTTFSILTRLRVWFYRSLEPLVPARISGYRSGDLLNRITLDISSLENFYVRAIAPPLVALWIVMALCMYFNIYGVGLMLIYLCFALLAGVGLPALIGLIGRKPGAQWIKSRAQLSTILVDGLQGCADLTVYNQLVSYQERVRRSTQELELCQRKMIDIQGLQSMASILISHACIWSMLVLAIPLTNVGKLPGVLLAMIVLVALTSFEAISPLPVAAQYLSGSLHAAGRLFDLVDVQPLVKEPEKPTKLADHLDLEVKNLSFYYASRYADRDRTSRSEEPWVLDQLSLELPQGKHLAVVGTSGVGKTTLVQLLLRFWEYPAGEVLLNQESIRNFNGQELRKRIAVVPQNPYLFTATLRENLLIARPEAQESELHSVCQVAQLADFIQSLTCGFDTWVGEHGLRLSAGERQRLAIARALLKNAPLLVLDEPTAHLDVFTEREVMQAVLDSQQGRSVLLISHRLIAMQSMDEIIVLKGGKAIERGRHAELLTLGGYYEAMWKLQRNAVYDVN